MSIKELRGIIDDGTREIPLVNKFGKLICNIYIRPADISILDRYKALAADFKDITAPLKDLQIKSDGSATFDEEWEIMKSVEAELKARINALFDMDEADAIFEKRNPFSSVRGKFFCEIVVEAIGGIITEAVAEEMKLSKQRTDKYLNDLTEEVNQTVEQHISNVQPMIREVSGDDGTTPADT